MRSGACLTAAVLVAGGITMAASSQAGEGSGRLKAASYINPDTGAATENPNVNPNSSCRNPDRRDRQRLSDADMSNRNVHNDACLFRAGEKVDGIVTFKSRGVGGISACPDPDMVNVLMDGPKVSFTHDHNGDDVVDHCHQSGYQEKETAGDREFHIRLNNTSKAGKQRVVFCYDPDQNPSAAAAEQPGGHGCGDERAKRKIVIKWKD
jgi:hypothetical protein